MAVQGLRTYDSKPIVFDDVSAMEILDGACKLVFERFRNCAYETSFYDKAHQLRWDLVELIELYSWHGPQINLCLWVTRLRWERDCESVFMNDHLCRWKYVVESSGGSCVLTRERLQKLSLFKDNKKYCLDDVIRFINGIRANLVTCFAPLLTVTCSHVAEVVSNLSDVPLTLLLPSTINSKKLKAMHMTNLRVLEQRFEVYDIYDTLARPSGRSSSSTRPRASFLLLGQTGAGKTEIAKAVAEHWYCDASRLVKIHMPDYADESALWGRLAQVVAKRPYSVIVLDKIDKVWPSARRALVNVLSKESGDVDLSNSIIFMTSSVGSDELALVCRCHHRDEETHKLFLQNPCKFLNTHDCTLKGSGHERAVIEARKFFSADVLDSVDKVLAVKRFHNDRAVCRVLLREVVREVYGQRLVVLASNDALFFLVNKNILTQIYEEGGKALKKMLMEKVIRGLPDAGRQDLKNVVVYVDRIVGTTQVSFSIHRHEQSADDWYFKLKDGTCDKLMANLRTKVESVCRIFKLRSQYLLDCNGDDDGSTRELLAGKIFDEILMWSPFQEMPSDIYRDITESSVPSSWERKQKDCPIYIEKEEFVIKFVKRRGRSLVAAGKKEQQFRVVAARKKRAQCRQQNGFSGF